MPFDRYNRNIDYLRISLTDACNLRCVYCMPEQMTFRPRDELLSDDELRRLIGLFGAVGFRKIRFTGGEPTLRASLVDLVRHAMQTPGIEAVGLTTNGVLLATLAAPLRAAGLRSVNLSLDTLDPEKFRRITRWGRLDAVLAGLDAAAAAGLRSTPSSHGAPMTARTSSPSPATPSTSRGRCASSSRCPSATTPSSSSGARWTRPNCARCSPPPTARWNW